jgi:Protein of unknown function (DUF3616)
MRIAASKTIVIMFLGLAPSIAAGEVQFGAVQVHKGTCEPSAAVAVPDGSLGTFIVANDEKNTLQAYGPEGGGKGDVAGGDLNKFLKLNDEKNNNEADFEGAAWLNGKVYWIGSHSRSRKGHLREARWQFFATQVSVQSNKPVVKPTSDKAFNGLLPAIAALDQGLKDSIKLEVPTDEDLAPDAGGFNIEGLTARADGKSLLIAVRSPLLDGHAVLLPLENPEGVAEKNEKPVLGSPIKLKPKLGGRGIRSIEYSAAAKTYFIMVGPSGETGGSFDLLRWPADEKEPATPVPGFAAALKNLDSRPFRPEAMVVDATGKKLHLFSDDGDDCEKIPSTFRSVSVTVE